MAIFQTHEDHHCYLQFLAEEAGQFGVKILAWCLIFQSRGNENLCGGCSEKCVLLLKGSLKLIPLYFSVQIAPLNTDGFSKP